MAPALSAGLRARAALTAAARRPYTPAVRRPRPSARPLRSGATLVLAALAGCGGAADGPRDVLLVTVDTLRADVLSCYGHARRSTPALDALAAEGALFERHWATAPMTAPSHATLFTGLWSSEHGVVKNGRELAPEPPTVAAVLADAGYRTVGVIGAAVLDGKYGLGRGFEVYEDDLADSRGARPSSAERVAADVVDRTLSVWAALGDGEPLFTWVHLFDPHAPFEAPVELLPRRRAAAVFATRVEPSDLYDEAQLVAAWIGYELEVAYTDREIGRLLAAFDARAGGPRGVVCVTSDHGEGLGEHGYMGHDLYLYEEQLHVPLILRARGAVPPGTRVRARTSAVDVAHTLVALAGALGPDEASPLPGFDLAAVARGEGFGRAPVAERPLFSAWDFERPQRRPALEQFPDRGHSRGAQVALVDGDGKFIWSEDVRDELYDLAADPREERNLDGQVPGRSARFRERLETWRASREPAFASRALDDAATRAMLDALGY